MIVKQELEAIAGVLLLGTVVILHCRSCDHYNV